MDNIIKHMLSIKSPIISKTLLFKFIVINIKWYDVIINDDKYNGYRELTSILNYYFWYDINAYSSNTYDIINKRKIMHNFEDYIFNIYIVCDTFISDNLEDLDNNEIHHCYVVKKYPAPWECIHIISYLYKYLNLNVDFMAPEKTRHLCLYYKNKSHEYKNLLVKYYNMEELEDTSHELEHFQTKYLIPILLYNGKYLCLILDITNKNSNKYMIVNDSDINDIYYYCINTNRFRGINICRALSNLY